MRPPAGIGLAELDAALDDVWVRKFGIDLSATARHNPRECLNVRVTSKRFSLDRAVLRSNVLSLKPQVLSNYEVQATPPHHYRAGFAALAR